MQWEYLARKLHGHRELSPMGDFTVSFGIDLYFKKMNRESLLQKAGKDIPADETA